MSTVVVCGQTLTNKVLNEFFMLRCIKNKFLMREPNKVFTFETNYVENVYKVMSLLKKNMTLNVKVLHNISVLQTMREPQREMKLKMILCRK